MEIVVMLSGYSICSPSDYLVNVINIVFAVASILVFAAIVLTINQIRHRFSAAACFKLGVLLFLFVLTVNAQIRLLICEYFLARIIDSLLLLLSKIIGTPLGL